MKTPYGRQLFEGLLYYAAAVSIGLLMVWIAWMPLLHVMLPDLDTGSALTATTISHTFAAFSTPTTLWTSAPRAVLFTFRTYRVAGLAHIAGNAASKAVFLALAVAEYAFAVVLRYDTITSTTHYAFTAVLLVALYLYHALGIATEPETRGVKSVVLVLSLASMGLFAAFVVAGVAVGTWQYAVACAVEIAGVLLVGLLDLVDIYAFSATITGDCA